MRALFLIETKLRRIIILCAVFLAAACTPVAADLPPTATPPATLGQVGTPIPSPTPVASPTVAVSPTPTPTFAASPTAASDQADPVLIAAGDIADCSFDGHMATAQLVKSLPGTVLTLGDNTYPQGAPGEFSDCYARAWGAFKARTRPVPGNHDYGTAGAAGYFGYFGAAAGPAGKGYYSFDEGAWHIIALNSELRAGQGSEQEKWLRADLLAHRTACTLAYWHKPRFSSGPHGSNPTYQAFWQALWDNGADIVLNGHDHDYERFAPQSPSGISDPAHGIREFVVGTGGGSLYPFIYIAANSQVKSNTTWGVLKLTLHVSSYDWKFIPAGRGTFSDSGSDICHS